MIIIAGHWFTEGNRDAALQAFSNMLQRARKHDGCLDISISADPLDADRINVFELWRDQETLDAWRKVAKGPRGIKYRKAQVKLYCTDKAEKPF
ncbi:putative quinol monooxygenase [Sphingosinicella sp.]|uniref:putative quinol monooxygenase n=1 Tax=Sphingosinicella sp. TaxID=1917971 RepID=UPI004037C040